MAWAVEQTEAFARWYAGLSAAEAARVDDAIGRLKERGPVLGRPFADTLQGVARQNLKELRPRGGVLRVLFAFDPRRVAVLLVGGDKAREGTAWYRHAVPAALALYDEHLAALAVAGELPPGGKKGG